MELIDTHTHLYLEDFKEDRDEVIQRAVDAGVHKLFLPNIDSSTFSSLMGMVETYHGICYPMAGLHPSSIKDNYKEELDFLTKKLDEYKFIAIGETGIDLYWDKTYRREQEEAFAVQIGLATKYKIPIVIHARESFEEIFKVLEQNFSKGLRGVFHSFTGGIPEIERIKEFGFYFGLNGIISFKNSGMNHVIPRIPRDRILLETDSPFLAPVPRRGKRNESENLKFILEKLAELLRIPSETLAKITCSNALELFNPDGK